MEIGSHDAGRMPDYTDPSDTRRLRVVVSAHGWSADRDDPDPIALRGLYADMDSLAGRLIDTEGSDVGYGVGLSMARTWVEIRRIQRGGE